MISAKHVRGKLNTIADSESRVFNDSSEWKLDPKTIFPFLKGCEIDLLAYPLSFPVTSAGIRTQRHCTRMH